MGSKSYVNCYLKNSSVKNLINFVDEFRKQNTYFNKLTLYNVIATILEKLSLKNQQQVYLTNSYALYYYFKSCENLGKYFSMWCISCASMKSFSFHLKVKIKFTFHSATTLRHLQYFTKSCPRYKCLEYHVKSWMKLGCIHKKCKFAKTCWRVELRRL